MPKGLTKRINEMMKKILTILLLTYCLTLNAQDGKYTITEKDYDNHEVEMADIMRSNGKIYVVVGVILIIFIGLTAYAIVIDRKISKIEKEVFSKKSLNS